MPTVADRLLKHIRENPGCGRASACVACDINPAQLAYAERRIAGGPVEIGAAERVIVAAMPGSGNFFA